MNELDRFLGIDYGESRIGLAVSYGTLAEPLQVISGKNTERAIQEIAAVCKQYGITALVVGQSEQEMAAKSIAFGQTLAAQLQLPVSMSDETLTSVEVTRKLRQTREKKRQYRGQIDHFAAAEILQRWLDETQ